MNHNSSRHVLLTSKLGRTDIKIYEFDRGAR